MCGCPHGEKRASTGDLCRAVESWNVPLWVIRRNNHNIVYNETFANPVDALNKEYVRLFETGVGQCYPHTELRGSFVSAEVCSSSYLFFSQIIFIMLQTAFAYGSHEYTKSLGYEEDITQDGTCRNSEGL